MDIRGGGAVVGSDPVVTGEVYVIPLDEVDHYLIYAPLRQAAFVGNGRLVNAVADLRDGCFDAAVPGNGELLELLRRLEIVDAGPDRLPVTKFSGVPKPTMVTLFMTTTCNLRCTYCYASAGDTAEKAMPIEVAKQGIRFVARNAKELGRPDFEIAYHGGGEPTTHWDVMVESFRYAREVARDLRLAVRGTAASNGVLSRQQTEWIVANLDGVSLSFDGLPETHDRHRLTVVGQGSSHVVMKTMERFDDASFRYGVRMTVTRDQIAKLPESVEFVTSRFKPQRIQVEPAYQLGRWRDAPTAETEEFIAAFRAARERGRTLGHEITFSAARVGLLTNHFCGVTQDSFALSPDGNVSGCYEVFSEDDKQASTFFYGRPRPGTDDYEFNLAALDALRALSVEGREFCRGCYAKWHCAGDCLNKAYTESGTTEFLGSARCHITRELTKDQLLERIARAGGLFWHELPGAAHEHHRPAGKELLG
jgi:uncharacterized protein